MKTRDDILLEQAYIKIYESPTASNDAYVVDVNPSPLKGASNFFAKRTFALGQSGIGGDSRSMAIIYFNNQVRAADTKIEQLQQQHSDGEQISGEDDASEFEEGGYDLRLRQGETILRHLNISINGIRVVGWNDTGMSAMDWAKKNGFELVGQ